MKVVVIVWVPVLKQTFGKSIWTLSRLLMSDFVCFSQSDEQYDKSGRTREEYNFLPLVFFELTATWA